MQNYPPQGGPAPKSKAPWLIAGGIGCALLLIICVIAVVGTLIYIGSRSTDRTTTSTDETTTCTDKTNTSSGEVATSTDPTTTTRAPVRGTQPAANTKRYVNTREGRTGKLLENYVDFSFDYPDTWELDPDPEPSYVRVERKAPNSNTRENFSVGWFESSVPAQDNRELLSKVVNNYSQQVSGNFPGFEKVSEGFTNVGPYRGYELRFQRNASQVAAGQLPYWGRVIVLPGSGQETKGVALIMVATGESDVKSVSDLGVRGELPVMLNSFRMGPPE